MVRLPIAAAIKTVGKFPQKRRKSPTFFDTKLFQRQRYKTHPILFSLHLSITQVKSIRYGIESPNIKKSFEQYGLWHTCCLFI